MTDDGTDDKDSTSVSQTISSETSSGTTVTTTTTHISKVSSTILLSVLNTSFNLLHSFYFSALYQVVKSGSSETRVEKRIVITADSDVDQDKVQILCPMTQNGYGVE